MIFKGLWFLKSVVFDIQAVTFFFGTCAQWKSRKYLISCLLTFEPLGTPVNTGYTSVLATVFFLQNSFIGLLRVYRASQRKTLRKRNQAVCDTRGILPAIFIIFNFESTSIFLMPVLIEHHSYDYFKAWIQSYLIFVS